MVAFDWLTVKLLMVLASTMILGSEFHGTHDHTLLSHGSRSIQTPLLTAIRRTLYNDDQFLCKISKVTSLLHEKKDIRNCSTVINIM
jgi:hypothetical protein